MGFDILFHDKDRILEVVYPASPSARDVAEYIHRTRAIVDSIDGPWSCLVDQRLMTVLSPDLLVSLADLNAHAQKKGMIRTARVVAGAVSEVQARRMARAAVLSLETFKSREDALAWLRSPWVPPATPSRPPAGPSR